MPNTMAEAFCEEYLITRTEHGQDFTGWRDGDIFTSWRHGDIFTSSRRMNEAGALSLFHQMEDDRLLIVSVFRTGRGSCNKNPRTAPRPSWEPERTNTASWISSTRRWKPGWNAWPRSSG